MLLLRMRKREEALKTGWGGGVWKGKRTKGLMLHFSLCWRHICFWYIGAYGAQKGSEGKQMPRREETSGRLVCFWRAFQPASWRRVFYTPPKRMVQQKHFPSSPDVVHQPKLFAVCSLLLQISIGAKRNGSLYHLKSYSYYVRIRINCLYYNCTGTDTQRQFTI